MISEKHLTKLEFFTVLELVSMFAVNTTTKREIMKLRPASDITEAGRALLFTEEAFKILFTHALSPSVSFDDPETALDKASVLQTMTIRDILTVRTLLRASRLLMNAIQGVKDDLPLSKDLAAGITTNRQFEELVDKIFIGDDEISDHASDKLNSIRKNIRRCQNDIRDKLNGFIRGSEMQKFLQDNIITIRNDRFVIPVKQEFRGNVHGLIHDQSASGATVFIEPMVVVELNNKLKTLVLDEQAEIEAILYGLTERIAPLVESLKINTQILTAFDEVFAKALFSNSVRGEKPLLNDKGRLVIKNGRHPLIDKKRVVPVSFSLGCEFNMLLISGPNTGGKTVTLKTAGLFTAMALSGIFIPADSPSEISVFSHVFCDIGDEQSIENNLSTFSSHISAIAGFLPETNGDCLILLDELGSGTDPYEGAALAKSIIDYLSAKKAKAIITTHYGELKEYSLTTKTIQNASMEFDPETFSPTYRLNVGIPGTSNAVEIAARLGLAPEIIKKTRGHLSAERQSFERVLLEAERIRQKSEKDQREVDALKAEILKERAYIKSESERLAVQKENFLKIARIEAKQAIAAAEAEAEEVIAEMKRMIEETKARDMEKALFKARTMKKELSNKKYNREDEIEMDDIMPPDLSGLVPGQMLTFNNFTIIKKKDKKDKK